MREYDAHELRNLNDDELLQLSEFAFPNAALARELSVRLAAAMHRAERIGQVLQSVDADAFDEAMDSLDAESVGVSIPEVMTC